MFSFFRHMFSPAKLATKLAMNPTEWFQAQIKAIGLSSVLPPAKLEASQASAKVFYNQRYLSAEDIPSCLTKIPAINVSGDSVGFFQNGLEFPSNPNFFKDIPNGHREFLSPDERLSAGKKILYSDSLVFGSGGYPQNNPRTLYPKPFSAAILSLAGATFENDYLHSRLFLLDPVNSTVNAPSNFSHLFTNSTTQFDQAKLILGSSESNSQLTRIRLGLATFLGRNTEKNYFPTIYKNQAVILQTEAYFKHLLEDIALLLKTVNDMAERQGKPALLKATAVGMGYFAKIAGEYDIKHVLFPYYLRAYQQLLSEHSYPWIAEIEFPILSGELQQYQFDQLFKDWNNPVKVFRSGRDVCSFTEEEIANYSLNILNPSDAFAYAGNELGFASVEAMIGMNTSLRCDQVYCVNPTILDPANHIEVTIDGDYNAELATESTRSPSLKG